MLRALISGESSVESIADLAHGRLRERRADLIRALENEDSRCLFGYGEAAGDSRAQEALTAGVQSVVIAKSDGETPVRAALAGRGTVLGESVDAGAVA